MGFLSDVGRSGAVGQAGQGFLNSAIQYGQFARQGEEHEMDMQVKKAKLAEQERLTRPKLLSELVAQGTEKGKPNTMSMFSDVAKKYGIATKIALPGGGEDYTITQEDLPKVQKLLELEKDLHPQVLWAQFQDNQQAMPELQKQLAKAKNPMEAQGIQDQIEKLKIENSSILTEFGKKGEEDKGFTLGPGQIRYDAQGNPIASGGESDKTPNEVELTRRALSGDKEAQAILNAMQKRKVESAAAGAKVMMDAKMEGMSIPGLAESMGEGKMASEHVRNAFGTPIQAKVETEVRKKYPNFSFIQNDANSKWTQNAANMRTIAMTEAALPRMMALDEQVGKLGNTDIPRINAVMRIVARETGRPEYTNFEANRNAIVQEINTALSGSATSSDLRIRIELENIQSTRSPAQLAGAIHNLREALISRLDTSLAVPYPLEVVRGEKTLTEFKEGMYKKYRGNYGATSAAGVADGGGFDSWVVDAKKANPSASDQELRDYYNKKYGGR